MMTLITIPYKKVLVCAQGDENKAIILNHPRFFVALCGREISQKQWKRSCVLLNASGIETVKKTLGQEGFHWAYIYPLTVADRQKLEEESFNQTACLHPDYSDGNSMGHIIYDGVPEVLNQHLLTNLVDKLKRPSHEEMAARYGFTNLESCCLE